MTVIFKIDSAYLEPTLMEILEGELGFDNDGRKLTFQIQSENLNFFVELFKRLDIKFTATLTN